MKKLLVLCGGQSPEHPISLRSTKNILESFDRSKYHTTIIGISRGGEWRHLIEEDLDIEISTQGRLVSITPGSKEVFSTSEGSLGPFDVVFPILHGPNGEDGTVQGLLAMLGLPFVGPNLLGSAVSMDKDMTKRLLAQAGIGVAPWRLIRKGQQSISFDQVKSEFGLPVFVKPANMGSSVGVHRVSNEAEWNHAIKDALSYDKKVLVEKSISGRELECAVLGNEEPSATGVGEVRSGNFYSFDEKYDATSEAEIIIPANVDETHLPLLKSTALKTYQTLECEGMSRVDMFLTDDGQVFVNEVNTIPGFTSISMYPKLWMSEGLVYASLLDRLIELAIERG
ncbi:MAG: D-alanine--D-alanine ligase [Ekhidna sp.]|nr:D-alanine--D-alanine ligase [Ekhidna sp.]